MKFNGSLTKLEITSLVKWNLGDPADDYFKNISVNISVMSLEINHLGFSFWSANIALDTG